MAVPPPRELKIGKIIDKTLGVIEHNAVPALIFVVVLTALSVPVTYFAVGSTSLLRQTGAQFLTAALGIPCAYFLLVAMLRRTGLCSRTDGDSFLPYIGLSILYSLGVTLGFIAIIIPGLFVMARWMIAQPMLVGGGSGVMEALGGSWERTKGNEFSIIFAGLALALLPIVAGIAISVLLEEGSLARIVLAQIVSSAASLVLMAMGVALYGLMEGARIAASPAN